MDVVLIRWPTDSGRRARLSAAREARLLLVEDGFAPPAALDCLEDWIRVPAPEEDVQARLDALTLRREVHFPAATPAIDDDGVLRFDEKWVALAPLEARLTSVLLSRFGAVVSRETLIRALWPGRTPGRNALDVHVLRLRRRLSPLGLAIKTVRSRGYLLEASMRRAEVNGA
ncbi:MAG TPA: winged helix-turn-helix domain-containing protein [Acidimicrobiales bacterium]|nr:winged helix-turn-helix domain-containing protein [Acidimicrobiales bacterium]